MFSQLNIAPLDPTTIEWRSHALSLAQPISAIAAATTYLEAIITDPASTVVERNRNAYELAWLQRSTIHPLLSSSLHLNGGDCVLLFLPGETFIEYQLTAQGKYSYHLASPSSPLLSNLLPRLAHDTHLLLLSGGKPG